MSITADGTMTAWQLAQQYLGDGRLYYELQGYSGLDPNAPVPAGTVMLLPNETGGAPATVAMAPSIMAGLPTYANPPDEPMKTQKPADIDQNVWDSMSNLLDEWNKLTGYRAVANQGDVYNLIMQGASSMFDIGFYMQQYGQWGHVNDTMKAMPWLAYGMDSKQYFQAVDDYSRTIEDLTGQKPTPDQMNEALISTHGVTDPAYWQGQFTQNQANRKQFGWIKYGMNYQQFQEFRDDQVRKFGHDLSDAEGARWLDEVKRQEADPIQGSKEISASPVSAPEAKSAAKGIQQAAVR